MLPTFQAKTPVMPAEYQEWIHHPSELPLLPSIPCQSQNQSLFYSKSSTRQNRRLSIILISVCRLWNSLPEEIALLLSSRPFKFALSSLSRRYYLCIITLPAYVFYLGLYCYPGRSPILALRCYLTVPLHSINLSTGKKCLYACRFVLSAWLFTCGSSTKLICYTHCRFSLI